jgi:hypothetical protein
MSTAPLLTWVVTCVPRSDGGPAVAPCGDTPDGQSYVPVQAQTTLVEPALAARLMAATEPFQLQVAMGHLAIFFGFTVMMYLIGLKLGMAVRAFR